MRKTQRFTNLVTDGEKLIAFGRYGASNGEFDSDASDIEIDAEGNVLIADTGNHRVVKFNADGKFILKFGVKGRGEGEFVKPIAVVALATGEILVKDKSQFKRFLGSPLANFLDVVSPSGQGLADTYSTGTGLVNSIIDTTRPRSASLSPNSQSSDLAILHRRIRLLEEAEYRRYLNEYLDEEDEKDENKKEEAEDLKIKGFVRQSITTSLRVYSDLVVTENIKDVWFMKWIDRARKTMISLSLP
ncbi:E3 ubiquitin-protein ligase TRIM71 [Geodia barretti]|uniref:E3 ubiquitin-protein ligase TRIM71 n=1 Tax=Geodia barretti TaxID=519541 RepID=A0AA35SJ91_GEOBA|nr:E3 ubiquitin-protein ligase TRIM71 [Geodia barretti]